jgi:hypothetical protein
MQMKYVLDTVTEKLMKLILAIFKFLIPKLNYMPEIGSNLKKYMFVYYSLWLTLKKI